MRHLIRTKLRQSKFIAVSNREPYVHQFRSGKVEWIRPASGMTAALDPVMQASRGLWVAHGSGDADATESDSGGFVDVPPDRPSYRLKRVYLSKRQEEGYYYGFANSAMWPLCHIAYRRPIFRLEQWEAYSEVNRLFAESVAREIGDKPAFVFVQDYHFALLPRMLRARCPRAILAHFWHIPWPNPEIFRICPWKHEILEGLLGNDILGFHTRYHCENFIATVDRELEARPDRERSAIVYRTHVTKIRAFPISIDFENVSRLANSQETLRTMNVLRRKYRITRDVILGIGADRLDYTKGLPERIEALNLFFERWPEYRGRVVFLQAGVPSRSQVEEYRRLDEEVKNGVAALNWRYGGRDWQPLIYLREHVPLSTLLALYRMSRFAIVSSLHDGMNLVAKEFVAAQTDANGVLILSPFTGAARELSEALIVNPYAPHEIAERIHQAIEMSPVEVRRRMGRMRAQVRENNIYKWAGDIIKKLSKFV
ncbi:MAG: alpha,alpha-trehalose-phosphate synthase (UDP-forming) [Candidatus Acidiferrales bacterium]